LRTSTAQAVAVCIGFGADEASVQRLIEDRQRFQLVREFMRRLPTRNNFNFHNELSSATAATPTRPHPPLATGVAGLLDGVPAATAAIAAGTVTLHSTAGDGDGQGEGRGDEGEEGGVIIIGDVGVAWGMLDSR
jgi:hypothetical protein